MWDIQEHWSISPLFCSDTDIFIFNADAGKQKKQGGQAAWLGKSRTSSNLAVPKLDYAGTLQMMLSYSVSWLILFPWNQSGLNSELQSR